MCYTGSVADAPTMALPAIHAQISDFCSYVMDYYGHDGIFPMGATKQKVTWAVNRHLKALTPSGQRLHGDTADREAVRRVLVEVYGLAPHNPRKK